jgi:hypothetical protein
MQVSPTQGRKFSLLSGQGLFGYHGALTSSRNVNDGLQNRSKTTTTNASRRSQNENRSALRASLRAHMRQLPSRDIQLLSSDILGQNA